MFELGSIKQIMDRKTEILLLVDGIINLILGILLLLFPFGISILLGVPESELAFYPSILGGVILGIGIALMIERFGYRSKVKGLGLGGAIVINLCGASVLTIWLILDPFDIPFRGYIVLWSIALIVLIVGIIELVITHWNYK